MKTLYALAVGAGAALRAPLWVRGRRFERLLDHGEVGESVADRAADRPSGTALLARRAALGVLRRLAWIPRSPWRNTCLYRSIAECQVLRYYGVPASIRLGVRNEAPPHGPVVAHAWVIYPGADDTGADGSRTRESGTDTTTGGGNALYVPLTPAGRAAHSASAVSATATATTASITSATPATPEEPVAPAAREAPTTPAAPTTPVAPDGASGHGADDWQ